MKQAFHSRGSFAGNSVGNEVGGRIAWVKCHGAPILPRPGHGVTECAKQQRVVFPWNPQESRP